MISYGAFNILSCIWLYHAGIAASWNADAGVPDTSFKSYSVIKPRILHGRSKREISSTKELNGHIPSMTIAFEALNRNYLLDIELNRNVVSRNALLRYQRNGTMVSDKQALIEDDDCYYSGIVRGSQSSSVALSTCDGISGLVFDGNRTMFVSSSGSSGRHFLYREEDLIENRTCGVTNPAGHGLHSAGHQGLRWKRSVPPRGPYNSNRKSRYVELVLVVDQEVYHENGDDLKATIRRTKQISNIVNALYAPLNIFVALVGVEVWTESDEITLSENGDTTLQSFLLYRRERLVRAMPNDNAQLLTGIVFQGGVVGKALKGPICTYEFSGGVNMDHSKQVSLVATTVAHEMGHNFGMEHDSEDCQCPEDRCIMSPSSSSVSPTHWSQCSLNYLAQAFGHGMDYCLRNKPSSLYDSPICGNGFVEPGEQCDCGLPNNCKNPCCNATTCMLRDGAVCASGLCCDLTACRPKKAGLTCRSAEHECDLAEYCTGSSEYCPDDVFKHNGLLCKSGESYCYDGVCRTRDDQCRILWGPSGKNSVDNCYQQNSKGNRLGNCGFNRLNLTYQRCQREDVMCGMLHCAHLNERLEFGLESAAIISATFINLGGKELPCRTAIVDLGLRERDPGLVPNGAPCGHRKMCVDQKCVPVSSVTEGFCAEGCSGNGVCNSRGHCHCDYGWGSPFCSAPGVGGSSDSGPALDNSAANTFVVVLFIVFLGLVPAAAMIFCCVYFRRNNISLKETFRLSSSVGGVMRKPAPDGRKKPSKERNGAGLLEMAGRQPAPASFDPAAPLTQTEGGSTRDQLASNLVGHFNGFSIRPIKPEGEAAPAEPPAPPAEQRRVCEVRPTVKQPPPPAQDGARTTFGLCDKSLDAKPAPADARKPVPDKPPPPPPPAPPQGARTTFDMKPVVAFRPERPSAPPTEPVEPAASPAAAPAAVVSRTTFGMTAPTKRPAADRKPHDEAPADAPPAAARTTFTARAAGKPAPAASPPEKPPPPPRPVGAVGPTAASAPVSPTAAPAAVVTRPLSVVSPLESVPDARSATPRSDGGSRSSTLDSNRSDTLRSTGSDRDTPFGTALSRVSGIFRRGEKGAPGSPDPGQRPAGLHPNQSFKAAKIDRDRLKNMEISAPIPQSVAVPESAVPVGGPPGSPQPAAGQFGTLPGSPATAAARARRPVSFPCRPSAPPPRPPAAGDPPPAADDVYDDCNLEAPAAREPTSSENIYSTIEEAAEEPLYSTPPDEPAGDDLLSEIAAELRTKDTALYTAVNKKRPRPAPPGALYQNVPEPTPGLYQNSPPESAPPPPLPNRAATEPAPAAAGGEGKPAPASQRVRSPSPKAAGDGGSQRVRSPSPRSAEAAGAGARKRPAVIGPKPESAPKVKPATGRGAGGGPRPAAGRGRAAPALPKKPDIKRPPFK